MKRKLVVYIRFNANDLHLNDRFHTNSLSKEWIEERIYLFQNYTRVSLESQTHQEFLTVLRVHPDTVDLVTSCLQKYDKLNDNIIFTTTPKELIRSYITGSDELYLAQIDSDDMYHPNYMKILSEYTPKETTSALINKKGYLYELATDKLCHYSNFSPSVFVQLLPVKEYLNHYIYYPEFSHVFTTHFPHEEFPENNFIIMAHKKNTFTTAPRYYPFEITDSKEKNSILSTFHLSSRI